MDTTTAAQLTPIALRLCALISMFFIIGVSVPVFFAL